MFICVQKTIFYMYMLIKEYFVLTIYDSQKRRKSILANEYSTSSIWIACYILYIIIKGPFSTVLKPTIMPCLYLYYVSKYVSLKKRLIAG